MGTEVKPLLLEELFWLVTTGLLVLFGVVFATAGDVLDAAVFGFTPELTLG